MFEYWWKNTPLRGRPDHGFIQKLKGLKTVLKSWNTEVFGCNTTKRNQLMTEIAIIDSLEDSTPISIVQHEQIKSESIIALLSCQRGDFLEVAL